MVGSNWITQKQNKYSGQNVSLQNLKITYYLDIFANMTKVITETKKYVNKVIISENDFDLQLC